MTPSPTIADPQSLTHPPEVRARPPARARTHRRLQHPHRCLPSSGRRSLHHRGTRIHRGPAEERQGGHGEEQPVRVDLVQSRICEALPDPVLGALQHHQVRTQLPQRLCQLFPARAVLAGVQRHDRQTVASRLRGRRRRCARETRRKPRQLDHQPTQQHQCQHLPPPSRSKPEEHHGQRPCPGSERDEGGQERLAPVQESSPAHLIVPELNAWTDARYFPATPPARCPTFD